MLLSSLTFFFLAREETFLLVVKREKHVLFFFSPRLPSHLFSLLCMKSGYECRLQYVSIALNLLTHGCWLARQGKDKVLADISTARQDQDGLALCHGDVTTVASAVFRMDHSRRP